MSDTRDWITTADEYVPNLSEETLQIAKDELREDECTRNQALASLREWIVQNPRIKNCRLDVILKIVQMDSGMLKMDSWMLKTDIFGAIRQCDICAITIFLISTNAKFLLRFLRAKKFSVPQAQVALERYLLLRRTFGVAFCCLDISIPMMQQLTDLGYLFACPKRDSKGRRVIVARPGVFDPYKFTNADMCRIHGIVYETLMEDEENQIRGYVHFNDGQGVGFSHLTLFTPKEAVRIVKNGEKTLPMRHKEVHVINAHPSVKFALDFGLSLISEKIKKRVKIYTNLEEAIAAGEMELEILPKEYGGIVPMSEMIELWKLELEASHDRLLSHDDMSVHEEMYTDKERDGAVSALKQSYGCGNVGDVMYGVTGNFRKLEVD